MEQELMNRFASERSINIEPFFLSLQKKNLTVKYLGKLMEFTYEEQGEMEAFFHSLFLFTYCESLA